MRISKGIVFFTVFCLGTLFAYGWMSASGMSASSTNRKPVVLSAFPIPLTTPALQQTLNRFTLNMRSAMATEGIPALAYAVVYDGKTVVSSGFGVTDVDRPQTVDSETVFRLASLSKGFAPVLVGMLVDEGLLKWDDLVTKFLPDFRLKNPEATHQLTIRQLLSHTTGLPRQAYSNLLNQEIPYRKIVPMLAGVNLTHSPGTYYNYQNVAYSLIGDVLEKVSGLSYDSLLTARLFTPLNMQHASVGFAKMQAEAHAALPHGPDAMGYHRLEFKDKWYDVMPAAGVNASVQDMGKWLQLLMGNHPELISANSLQEITRKQIDVSPQESVMRPWKPLDDSGYGLGWRTLEKFGRKIVFHGGFVSGYRAEIGFCASEKIGIVLLSNGANGYMRDALPGFFSDYFAHTDQLPGTN